MLDAIKRVFDDNFVFQQHSAPACSTQTNWQSTAFGTV